MNTLNEYMTSTLMELDDIVEQSDEYQSQKSKMNACIKNFLKDKDPEKKEHVNLLLQFIKKEQEQLANDTFSRGFSLGALATMETYLNRENYRTPQERSPNPYLWGGAEGANERFRIGPSYVSLIIDQLAEERLKTVTLRPNDPLLRNSEKKFRDRLKNALLKKKLDGASYYDFEAKIYAINVEMLHMKSRRRFSFGYSMGSLVIMDVFECRDLLITE